MGRPVFWRMRVTDIVLARTVWLFDISRLNQKGIALGVVHRALLERYRFISVPKLGPESFEGKGGLTYGSGEFEFEGSPLSVGFTIYSDGWWGDSTLSTDVSDAFLNDVSQWLISTFSFRNPQELTTKRVYDSSLNLESDVLLMNMSDKVRLFSELLRTYTGNATEEAWAMLFEPDGGNTSFTFERRVNVPFSTKQYYSKALLSTERHIELLGHFEEIFKA